MKQCPYCGSTSYEIETINQAEVKKCLSCGSYYEDAGEEFEISTFVPVYERDNNGMYPGCPKCGCREVRYLSMDELRIRSFPLSAWIAGEPYEPHSLSRRRFECQNPECRYRW